MTTLILFIISLAWVLYCWFVPPKHSDKCPDCNWLFACDKCSEELDALDQRLKERGL